MAKPAPREARPRLLLWLAVGFTIWTSALVALYAWHSFGCAFGWRAWAIRLGMTGALALHLAALAGAILVARRLRWPQAEDVSALARITHWTIWAAIVATLFTFTPPIALSICLP